MRKLLVVAFALAFICVSVPAMAGGPGCQAKAKSASAEGKDCSHATKVAKTECKPGCEKACCAEATMVAQTECGPGCEKACCAEATMVAKAGCEASKAACLSKCPTTQVTAVNAFHQTLHPMHQALDAKNFDALRKHAPELAEKMAALIKAEVDESYGKDYEENCGSLKKAVAEYVKLAKSDASDDDLVKAFMVVHDSYVNLNNCCAKTEKAATVASL